MRLAKYFSYGSFSRFEARLLWVAFIVHLIAVWFSVGFHHADEYFQIIEFANYKLGHIPLEKLAWEFSAEIRPGLQPLMVYVLLKAYYFFGFSNPFYFATLLRLMSGMLALITAWQFHKAILPQIKSFFWQRVHLVLSLLGWGLVYLHVRFSSENWSAIAFTWALISLWRGARPKYFVFGLLAGFSFLFRFQAIFMIGAAGLWMLFVGKANWKNILQVILGFLLVFGMGMLCDRWLYGHWAVSSIGYVYQNIIANKAAQFGVFPWYWYFQQIVILGLAPYSIFMLLSIPLMLVYRPKNIITWCMVLFLLAHIVVGHKEFRFLFPLAFFYPFLAINSLELVHEKLKKFHQLKGYILAKNIFAKSFWLANGIALILMITKPANDLVALNQVFYDLVKKETLLIYSHEFDHTMNGGSMGVHFYAHPLITSYNIDKFIKDTNALKNKEVWIFSEKARPQDEFIFNSAGSFFDSSKTSILWSRYPQWIYKFNFNGWIERSNVYTLYRLNQTSNP